MKKTKKPEVFTGINLEKWRSDVQNINWAQTSAEYRMIISVVLHEGEKLSQLIRSVQGSEARAFGFYEGFFHAVEILRSAARKEDEEAAEVEETYDQPPQKGFQVGDVRD